MFTHFLSFLFGGALIFFALRYIARINLDTVVILLTGKRLKEFQRNASKEAVAALVPKDDSRPSTPTLQITQAPVTAITTSTQTPNPTPKLRMRSSADVDTSKKPTENASKGEIMKLGELDISTINTSVNESVVNTSTTTNNNNTQPVQSASASNVVLSASASAFAPIERKSSRQLPTPKVNGKSEGEKEKVTPQVFRHRSSEFSLSDMKAKRLSTSVPNLKPESESLEFSGWMEIASKTPVKLVWNTHYFYLRDSWLSWYKNETKRADQCYGWIKIKDVELEPQVGKLKIYIKHKNGKPIFHRHGPNRSVPPTPRSHYLFHRKSATCRLRFKDEKAMQQWIFAFQKAIEKSNNPVANTSTAEEEFYSSDSESEDVSDVSMTDDPPIETLAIPKTAEIIPVIEPEEGRVVLVRSAKVAPIDNATVSTESSTSESTAPTTEGSTEETVNAIPTSDDNREGLMSILKNAIGLDITTVSLPVSLFEPTSFLQRMCELIVYYDLLNKADTYEDSCHRLTFVTSFAISLYASLVRTSKPFNPYLGETFEYIKEKENFKFLAEQVSHHPPIGACIAETDHFIYWQEQGLKTSFGGNSLACESVGEIHIILKSSNDHYVWSNVKTVVHNCILGKMWIDHYGETKITNQKTGDSANLKFRKCGWFGKGQSEVEAWILDSQGQTRITLEGKWNDSLRWTHVNGPQLDAPQPIWVHTNKNDKSNHWNLTPFMQELCVLDDSMKAHLPKTDSRLRPDRLMLETRDLKKAGQEKSKLEKEQRALRKTRETQGKSWNPQNFVRREDGVNAPDWAFTGKYWEERAQRIAKASNAPPKQPEQKKND